MSDLIDRQALNEYIRAQRGRPFIGITLEDAILMMISEVPSVQPRKGKWIETDRWDEVCDTLCECSECHSFVLVEEDYKYCPYCGADMRGEQDE